MLSPPTGESAGSLDAKSSLDAGAGAGVATVPLDDAVCSVCGDAEGEDGNEIIFCDGCNLAVHQLCYGVAALPEGEWYCSRCSAGVGPHALCCVCQKARGAMKPVEVPSREWLGLDSADTRGGKASSVTSFLKTRRWLMTTTAFQAIVNPTPRQRGVALPQGNTIAGREALEAKAATSSYLGVVAHLSRVRCVNEARARRKTVVMLDDDDNAADDAAAGGPGGQPLHLQESAWDAAKDVPSLWCHVVCAMWVPELYFLDADALEPIAWQGAFPPSARNVWWRMP